MKREEDEDITSWSKDRIIIEINNLKEKQWLGIITALVLITLPWLILGAGIDISSTLGKTLFIIVFISLAGTSIIFSMALNKYRRKLERLL